MTSRRISFFKSRLTRIIISASSMSLNQTCIHGSDMRRDMEEGGCFGGWLILVIHKRPTFFFVLGAAPDMGEGARLDEFMVTPLAVCRRLEPSPSSRSTVTTWFRQHKGR